MTLTIHLCSPSDQPRPADLLIGRLPVAVLPVLPPQTAAEGKGGQRQEGQRSGDAGAQPHRGQRPQTPQQRLCRRGGLDNNMTQLRIWGNCRVYFCTCLQKSTSSLLIHIHIVWHWFFCSHCWCKFCSHKPNHPFHYPCFAMTQSQTLSSLGAEVSSSFVAVYLFWFRSKSQSSLIWSHRFHSHAHPGMSTVYQTANITVLEKLLYSFHRLLVTITILANTKEQLKDIRKVTLAGSVLFQKCAYDTNI